MSMWKAFVPAGEEKVVKPVGTDEMLNGPEARDLREQILARVDRRPGPQSAGR